jgi:hypothetical protein
MGTWNPFKGARIGPAWARIVRALSDGQWRPWPEVQAAGLEGSDLFPATVNNLIYEGVKLGYLERDGRYARRGRIHTDERSVRLACAGPWAANFGGTP